MTIDNTIEQYFIDLIKLNSTIITGSLEVNHIKDNSVFEKDAYILVSVDGTAPIYSGLKYMKTTLNILVGTRVINCDADGTKRDTNFNAVQTVLSAISKGDKSLYGFAIDGFFIKETATQRSENNSHIIKSISAEILFREIPIVPEITTP